MSIHEHTDSRVDDSYTSSFRLERMHADAAQSMRSSGQHTDSVLSLGQRTS
jgi:hypothetical protein